MITRTITAFFDSQANAQAARSQLLNAGLPDEAVRIVDRGEDEPASTAATSRHRGIWEAIRDFFTPDEDDRAVYEEGIRRGGYLLVAQASEENADRVIEVLNACDAIDLDARASEWQRTGWTRPAMPQDTDQELTEEAQTDVQEARIPVADEQLRIGKREVNRGSVRVRSYVHEEPVHEQVRLREEHVEVERRPVNEPLSAQGDAALGDKAWQDREVEMTEKGEEAVVGKEAVVKEEVVLKKQAQERTERIDDTVRHTEVDVEDTRGRKPAPSRTAGRPEQRH